MSNGENGRASLIQMLKDWQVALGFLSIFFLGGAWANNVANDLDDVVIGMAAERKAREESDARQDDRLDRLTEIINQQVVQQAVTQEQIRTLTELIRKRS